MKKYPQLRYEVLATSQERMNPISADSYFYRELSKVIMDCGFTPRPFSFEATTDARFYSHRGIPVIGLTPFMIAPNLHGTDEYIRIKDFEQGIDIIYSFLKKFCVSHNGLQ
jgi:acetylornithine deacetylase/succinyl-diaminopimelate desuccinylase-like protein